MEKQIVIGENLVCYSETCNPQAEKTLIFLHGWRSSSQVWGHVVESLSSCKVYKVFAIDLPGFGNSPLPPPCLAGRQVLKRGESLTVLEYAEVVKGFIEKLDLKNVIIIGHSFGGRVGIKLSSLITTPPRWTSGHPSLNKEGIISKLVLVDSAGFAMSSTRKSFYGMLAKIVKPFFKPKFMHGLREKIYKFIGAEDYLATPELQKTFVNVVGEDLSEDMKKINIPTLIIFGENDLDTPVAFGMKMQSLINNSTPPFDGVALSNDRAKFQILKNAGHFSFLDQPKEFVKILEEFISSPF